MKTRRDTVLAVVGVLVLCGLSARVAGQADHGRIREDVWNDSLPSALSVARYTGRPVLIFFEEYWCGYCEQLEQLLVHRDVKEATRRFILVKLNWDLNRPLAREYKIDLHHQLVMLDWSGKPIGRVKEFKSERAVALKVIEAAAANDLNAAAKLTELGYYDKAAERYRIVSKISRDKSTIQRAEKGLEDLRGRAKRQLDLIRQLIRAGRLDEAADACAEFIDDFPPEMGREEVEKLLAKLKSGRVILPPDVKPPAGKPKPKSAEEAKRLVEQAMVYEWDKRFYDAVTSYEKTVRDYPETPSAEEAKLRLQLLLKEPGMRELIARQKMEKYCTRWLEMGELYEKNGRDDMAIKYYNTIVAVYPESTHAAEARRRLVEIERRHMKRKSG
ncbi:MAG: hypothetical protein AMS16_02760 [Planctomycetes bacterium DG_58]|nr:MAG: hypothetical protein AMS16_02760 [Planctomycetes bacterium DG_58]